MSRPDRFQKPVRSVSQPTKITFGSNGTIEYIYNSVGQKLKKIVTDYTTSPVTTDYLTGFQYKNNVLTLFPTAEGYVNFTASKYGTYKYVFNYTDHLGNVRLSYSLDSNVLKILEENHYYAFGLKHTNYNTDGLVYQVDGNDNVSLTPVTPLVGSNYKYKYNGKELQEELGLNMYDYGARNYDPSLGRWMNMDPLAEKYFDYSTYTYAINNPIFFIDPDGMQIDVSALANSKNKNDGKLLIGLMASLADISGMTITMNTKNGKTTLSGIKDDKIKDFSSSASKYASHLLTMGETITVSSTVEGSTSDPEGKVQLDYAQIKGIQKGLEKKGIDKNVMSVGMAFLHETAHTKYGAKWWKNPQSVLDKRSGIFTDYGEGAGFVDNRINGFRQQLGLPTLYARSQPSTLFILVKGEKVKVPYSK